VLAPLDALALGDETGVYDSLVHRVDVVNPEHDSSPDGPPGSARRTELKVEEAAADPEARESRLVSSVEHVEAERMIEGHRSAHVDRQQRDSADALNGLGLVHANSLAGTVVRFFRVGFERGHTRSSRRALGSATSSTPASPDDAPWGERYFHIRDPDGHELSFARPLPAR